MFYLLKTSLFSSLSGLLLISIFSFPVFPQELPKQVPGKTTKTEQQPETYNRGTKDLPVIVEISPSAPLKIETEHDKEAENKKAVNEGQIASGTIAIAIFTLVLAIATIALACFTYNLWGETGKLVVGADETAKKELRAYMGVERIRIQEAGRGAGSPGHWNIKIRNFGKTMAKDTEVWIGGTFVSVENFDFPLGERRSKTVVMPHEAMGFEEAIEKNQSGDIEAFKRGAASIYVWGKITYRDVFDKPHWTIFRFKSYKEGRPTESGLREWKVRADGECANDAE